MKTTQQSGCDARTGTRFRTTILTSGKTATGIQIPDEVIAKLGAGRRPPVKVTINDYTYRSTVAVMNGRFMVGVNADNRREARVGGGDTVDVIIALDTEVREVTVPADLALALDRSPIARKSFDRLSYSKRKAIVDSVLGAKTSETRARRIDKALSGLRRSRA
jgi:Bacteriocin-protection, YdeI or OmpD-Associated/Domain of unknown function (DUF1905)